VLIRSRMWIYDHTFPLTTQIRLYTMYFDSTDGATALLSNYTPAAYERMQEPRRSLNSLSTV